MTENYTWKVKANGEASIFSRSRAFTVHPVDRDSLFSYCGLNEIAYVSKGYLLVVQSNTGKMFKVVGSGGQGVCVKWACVGGYDGECGEGEI
ncbi:hypothetical protein FH972_010478 [Carpinus fangiana]|uniref:Uncharacterized protein n=1 Tax=Carpinus fangiana TaxID=176857 RepID=A0A660KR81_9ROSI|nr:hypothetical protein FH972_010478 [Carpinus fangiana]